MAKRKIKAHYGLTYNLTDRQAMQEITGLKFKAAKERLDDMDETLYAALQVWRRGNDFMSTQNYGLTRPASDPKIRKAAAGYNMIRGAGDHSEQVLIWAAYNDKLCTHQWCKCIDQSDSAYYRNAKTGNHGWACCHCHGVVQTG